MAWRAPRDAAVSLRQQGNLPEAMLECRLGLDTCTDDASTAECLLEWVRCLLAQGNGESALLHARRSASLAPHHAEAFFLVGQSLEALGRKDAAAVWWRRAKTLGYTEPPSSRSLDTELPTASSPPFSGQAYPDPTGNASPKHQVEQLTHQLVARTQVGIGLMQRLHTSEQRNASLEGRVRELEQQQQQVQQELLTLRQELQSRPPPSPQPISLPSPEPPLVVPISFKPSQPPEAAHLPPPPHCDASTGNPISQQSHPTASHPVGHPPPAPSAPTASVLSHPLPSGAPAANGTPAPVTRPRPEEEGQRHAASPSHPGSAAAMCDVIRRIPSAVLCDKVKDCFVSAVQAEARSTSQAMQLYMVAWLALQEWLTSHEAAAQPLAPLVEALLARISVLKAKPKPGPAKPKGSSQATSPNSAAPKVHAWAKHDPKPASSADGQADKPPEGVTDTLHAPFIIRDAASSGDADVVIQAADMVDCRPVSGSRASRADLIVASLCNRGFVVCEGLFTERQAVAIREKVRVLEAQDGLYSRSEIWVGKSSDVGAQLQVPDVRGDSVCWMSPEMIRRWHFTALEDVMAEVDGLVLGVLKGHPNLPELAGLYARSDPMLAVYPGGRARFQKHIDNSAQDGRKLTAVSYLNPQWRAEDGGGLRLHLSTQHKLDVVPAAGRVVLFFSERIPHEVLPSCRDRHAVTVWYYDRAEHERAKASAKEVSPTNVSEDARLEARDFIKDTVADTSCAHTLEEMRERAKTLSPDAARIIAGVVGAATAEEFLAAMDRLTPASLQNLRASFQQMGL